MIDVKTIQKHMDVLDPHGALVGRVDDVEDTRIKLTHKDAADDKHHYVRTADIARVDTAVHLTPAGAAALAADTAGVAAAETGGGGFAKIIPWLLLAAGVLALLLALSRCNREEVTTNTMVTNTADTMTPTAPLGVESVTLPNGASVDLEPNTLNYSLQRYLASDAAAPRTFTFDKLNFDTNSSTVRAEDEANVEALSRIMNAYPKAMATIVGYADARGAADANANLGADRAKAVMAALVSKGVAASRLKAETGGETNPAATNATAQGQFENRRTELTITAK